MLPFMYSIKDAVLDARAVMMVTRGGLGHPPHGVDMLFPDIFLVVASRTSIG